MGRISIVGVVGAGAMGAGIAQSALMAGRKVVLFDQQPEALEQAMGSIVARLDNMAAKGRLDPAIAETARGRIRAAAGLADFAHADLVVEAIVERLGAKQALLSALEDVVSDTAILATNTSSLSVAAIAHACRRKDRICGLHFFNPVPLMKLVEIVVTADTAPATVERCAGLVRELGKTPVTVKDIPGFLVNLAGRAFTTEALHVLWEGVADVATIDRIMRDGAGFRMGPFELMDLTGIDVNYPATSAIFEGFQYDPRLKTTPLHAAMFHAGRLGRKSGQGFYDYATQQEPPELPPPPSPGGFEAHVPLDCAGFSWLREHAGLTEAGEGPILIAPVGDDTTGFCHRHGIPPERVVAIDFTALDRRHLTLMNAPGMGGQTPAVGAWLRGHGFTVEIVEDSPGFVLQRILAMIANLGAELAQAGIGAPEDIDVAMKLAQNYPRGPIEWIDHLGAPTVYRIMLGLQSATGSDRYRPSLWLRRRALLEEMAAERPART